jgi:hypothetical protein
MTEKPETYKFEPSSVNSIKKSKLFKKFADTQALESSFEVDFKPKGDAL